MADKCPSKACLCSALCAWLFASVSLLTLTSILYLQPFIKVARYRRTACRVENYFYTKQYMCSCGHDCQSTYPCFVLHVSLHNVSSVSNHLWVVILYSDDQQQARVIHAEPDTVEQCSIKVCLEDQHENRARVDRFMEEYGHIGRELDCAYDPIDLPSGSVLRVITDGRGAFHAVFWPGLAIALGLLLCAVFCKKCRHIEEKKDKVCLEEAKNLAESAPTWSIGARGDFEFKKTHKQRSLRSLWL